GRQRAWRPQRVVWTIPAGDGATNGLRRKRAGARLVRRNFGLAAGGALRATADGPARARDVRAGGSGRRAGGDVRGDRAGPGADASGDVRGTRPGTGTGGDVRAAARSAAGACRARGDGPTRAPGRP